MAKKKAEPTEKHREILIQTPFYGQAYVKKTHVDRIKQRMETAGATHEELERSESIFVENFKVGNFRQTGTVGQDTPVYMQIYDFKIKFKTT